MTTGFTPAVADDAARPTPPDTGALFDRKPTPPATGALFDRSPRRRPLARCPDAQLLPCPRRDAAAPAALTTVLTRAFLRRLPSLDADVGAVAGAVIGTGRDDAGLSASGATGVDSHWTVDGAPIDAPYTGGLGLTVPLAFVEDLTVGTAGLGADSGVGVGAAVDARLRTAGAVAAAEGRVWLGAGRAAPWLPRARSQFTPFRGRLVGPRTIAAEAVVSGPLPAVAGGRPWYLVGVAPRLTDQSLERAAFRQADADGDGVADRDGAGAIVHEAIASGERAAIAYDVPFVARAGLRFGHHQLDVTALGEVARSPRWIVPAEDSAAGVERTSLVGTASATWRGQWGATSVRLQGAWFRSDRTDDARIAAGDAPAIGSAYVPPVTELPIGDALDQQVRAACADGTGDAYPLIANCPIATGFYWTGGAGALGQLTIDRPSAHAEVVHTHGAHRLALGVAGDDVRAVSAARYSGGLIRQRLSPDAFIDYQLVEVGDGPDTCAGTACTFLDRATITYRTRTVAAFVADTWRPAPEIAVEYGVRAQSSQLGTALTLREVLPRASVAWDFLGGGRSRAFVAWGRYAPVVPAGLGAVVYAGPTLLQTLTFAGSADESLGGSAGEAVQPDARGTRVDEALAGVEVGQPDVVRLGVSVRNRHLGRALDDELGALGTAGAAAGAVATREYDEVASWLTSAPTGKLAVRLGYTWSRLRGNWPGPYDPVEGYQLGGSSLFDEGPSAAYANATGPLPGDQPHRFFAELALRGRWRGLALDGGVRATAASGRPRSARIGRGQTFAVPRGALGRLPALTQANLHVGARRGRWSATLDVWNLFDRRGVVAVEESFARDASPIVGGDAGDLIWLKDDVVEGNPALRVDGYGQPTRYQAPISAIVAVAVEL